LRFERDGSILHRINKKYVREHRLVFEQHYNFCLLPRTAISHRNGISSDNRIENLEVWSKRARSGNFGRFAEPIPPDRHCMRCGSSKTRIEKDGRHHWLKKPGGYICSSCFSKEWRMTHTNAHRNAFEQHYNCCLLPKTEIRHKNGIKTDNRIENLEVLKKGGSSMLVTQRIPIDRRCMNCRSFYTPGDWSRKPGGYICNSCRSIERRSDLKRASTFDEEYRIIELWQKMQFDPNFMSRPGLGPRKCDFTEGQT
jgi:hypothetical protein